MAMFEPKIVIGTVTVVEGMFTSVKVVQTPDPQRPGHVGNMVIDPTRPFQIDIAWQLIGVIGNVNLLLNSVTNYWNVQVYAEKMGPGSDLLLKMENTPAGSLHTLPSFPASCNHSVSIPAGSPLQENVPPGSSGMYKLCIVVFANTNIVGADDIIGCYEGPMILVENPD
jgi:hypothetical protein